MINVEKAYKLIELLKTEETAKRFNMRHFFYHGSFLDGPKPVCGTASCIAGMHLSYDGNLI